MPRLKKTSRPRARGSDETTLSDKKLSDLAPTRAGKRQLKVPAAQAMFALPPAVGVLSERGTVRLIRVRLHPAYAGACRQGGYPFVANPIFNRMAGVCFSRP